VPFAAAFAAALSRVRLALAASFSACASRIFWIAIKELA
jgi:hypothetical protein